MQKKLINKTGKIFYCSLSHGQILIQKLRSLTKKDQSKMTFFK